MMRQLAGGLGWTTYACFKVSYMLLYVAMCILRVLFDCSGAPSRVATPHSLVNCFRVCPADALQGTHGPQLLAEVESACQEALETLSHPTQSPETNSHKQQFNTTKSARKQRWYAQLTLPQRQARQAAKETLVKFLTCNFGSDRLQFLSTIFWQWRK